MLTDSFTRNPGMSPGLVRWPESPAEGFLRDPVASGGGEVSDTFLMATRHYLFPQLASATSGSWAWLALGSAMFGGWYRSTGVINDSWESANLVLQPGTYSVKALVTTTNEAGIASIYFDGVDTGANLDMYSGSIVYNQVISDTFTVATKTRGTIKVLMETKNASSSAYRCEMNQLEITKTTAESNAGADLDDLPWQAHVPPVASSAATGPMTLLQSSTYAWGTLVRLTSTLNHYVEYKVDLKQGTFALDLYFARDGNRAILTVAIDGTDVGTIDQYGATELNSLATLTGITVATSGVHTVRLTAATKHASSTGYDSYVNWIKFRKTTTTGAITATGATYAPETLELWPWFAGTTNSDTFAIGASYINFGAFSAGTAAINDDQQWSASLNSGTYDVTEFATTGAASGIAHLSLDGGSDLDTVDHYSGSTVYNVALAMSGALSSGVISVAMDSKNASSSNYKNNITMIRLVRTGA